MRETKIKDSPTKLSNTFITSHTFMCMRTSKPILFTNMNYIMQCYQLIVILISPNAIH